MTHYLCDQSHWEKLLLWLFSLAQRSLLTNRFLLRITNHRSHHCRRATVFICTFNNLGKVKFDHWRPYGFKIWELTRLLLEWRSLLDIIFWIYFNCNFVLIYKRHPKRRNFRFYIWLVYCAFDWSLRLVVIQIDKDRFFRFS